MCAVRNLTTYQNGEHKIEQDFIYHGTAALVKGHGMCFSRAYAVAANTGQKVTDSWGARGLKEIEIPSSSNNMAFAGVLANSYPANPNGATTVVKLQLPGGCAMISQAATSVINQGLLTCAVCENDSGDTTLANGLFGYGGFEGRGSAIPLTTLAVADEGDMPMQEITGVCTSVYDSATGLTTFTCATGTPGTYMGYVATDLDADQYEFIVWGGADEATSTAERCPSGVYPVKQATGAKTFTVTGDTGNGACTGTLRKKNLLRLAYLMDGQESGLVDYFLPETAAVTEPILAEGTSIVLGGLDIAADCVPVVPDSLFQGARKGFYMLGTLASKEMLISITSGYTLSGAGIAGTTLSTVKFYLPGEWLTMRFRLFGIAGATYGAWLLEGVSDTGVVPA
jgi:hypothetical protein